MVFLLFLYSCSDDTELQSSQNFIERIEDDFPDIFPIKMTATLEQDSASNDLLFSNVSFNDVNINFIWGQAHEKKVGDKNLVEVPLATQLYGSALFFSDGRSLKSGLYSTSSDIHSSLLFEENLLNNYSGRYL